MKENKEVSNYQLTTIRGKHHDSTVVLAGTKFSALHILHEDDITWASVRVDIHSNNSQMPGQNGIKICKSQKRTIPKLKTRMGV